MPIFRTPGGWHDSAAIAAPAPVSTWRRSPFPELDCVRERLSLGMIAAVERRAISLGVGADRVLIANDIIDEETYIVALARWLGWDYESFEHRYRNDCPLKDWQLIQAGKTGMLPLMIGGEPVLVVAPRSVRHLLDYARTHPRLQIRLASSKRLNSFIADFAAKALGQQAANSLRYRAPDLSAGTAYLWKWFFLAPLLSVLTGLWIATPGPTMSVIGMTLAVCFLAWLALRFGGCFIPAKITARQPVAERDLPIYTVIVALYREADCVDELIKSLRALDYPPEKLDIKIVIEPYDPETRAALQRHDLRSPFEIVVAPQAGPQTKPKALNAALAFAHGSFIVVYDAEDRPETDQLRLAVEAFQSEGQDVACVQARLTIDNTGDGWLARLFTAEYAAQFDLFLPGLARLGLPLPLGGSSNHFRSDVLRQIGAWDSYNVTEDADLGMRLARFGYRSAVIDSTTYEEAPASLLPWLRQRTRWFKGWMRPVKRSSSLHIATVSALSDRPLGPYRNAVATRACQSQSYRPGASRDAARNCNLSVWLDFGKAAAWGTTAMQ